MVRASTGYTPALMSHRTTLLAATAASSLALVACAPPPVPLDTDTGTAAVEPADTRPSIRILFPNPAILDTDALCDGVDGPCPVVCPTFTVVVDVDNLDLSHEHYGLDPVEGEGHWHLHLDDPEFTGAAHSAVADPWATVVDPIEEGFHTIGGLVVQNNHFQLEEEQRGKDRAVVEIEVRDLPHCLMVPFGDGNYSADTGQ